jgi:hypothetical protein
MAVIITNMDMPKCCNDCIFWNYYEGHCRKIIPSKWKDFDIDEQYEKRADNCPLRSADEMTKEIEKVKTQSAFDKAWDGAVEVCCDIIRKYTGEDKFHSRLCPEQPTIPPMPKIEKPMYLECPQCHGQGTHFSYITGEVQICQMCAGIGKVEVHRLDKEGNK